MPETRCGQTSRPTPLCPLPLPGKAGWSMNFCQKLLASIRTCNSSLMTSSGQRLRPLPFILKRLMTVGTPLLGHSTIRKTWPGGLPFL